MRTPATRHQKLRRLLERNPSIFSTRDHDEALRRVRELDALEERGLGAYERGELDLAERLDVEYAEKADALEGWVAEIIEGHSGEDLEPGELDLHPLVPGGVVYGHHEGVVGEDLTARLSVLYDEFLETEGSRSDRFDPDSSAWRGDDFPFPLQSREDVLGWIAKGIIEDDAEQWGKLSHVPASEFVEAARDANERRHELVMRYRVKRARQPKPNPRNPIPRTKAVFDEMMDQLELGPFDDFGELQLAVDPSAGDGGDRQYAYCRSEPGSITIAFAPKAETLPHANLVGLMAHEVGHAIDARYPRKVILERLDLHGLAQGAERRADELALAGLGVTVRYDDRDVQCVGHGTAPRPDHLAQNVARVRQKLGEPSVLERGVVRLRGKDTEPTGDEYPLVYTWTPHHDGFSVQAVVPDRDQRGRRTLPLGTSTWPSVGKVGVERRQYGFRDVLAVYVSHVDLAFRRIGIGTRLYELAAKIACDEYRIDFASDVTRTEEADELWLSLGASLYAIDEGDEDYGGDQDYGDYDGDQDYYLLHCSPTPRRARRRRTSKNPYSEEEITPELLAEWEAWSTQTGLRPNAGQRVHAYRNLQPGRVKVPHRWPTGAVVYSVQDARTRRVVGAWPEVVIKDATFYVSGPGLARVRRQKQRAVIAWVTGEWKKSGAPGTGWERVYFNPWKVDHFIQSSTGRRIYRARWVRLDEDGAWAILGSDAFRP